MPFPRAKSPEDLYADLDGYDLVLTPDGPLAGALNRELDRPHLGPFATPPRRLAAGQREKSEDRLAFLEMVENGDVSWKRAAYAIGNILQCWEHQGTHDAILEYEPYVDDTTADAVDRIADLDTTSMELTTGQIDADRDVAVVEPEMLTPLERSFLPEDYDTIDLFTDASFDLPPFHIFDSPTSIVDTVVDAISEANAESVGIVLDQGSEYSALIESALEVADIPFFGGPGFIDIPEHRSYLQLLRTAHRGTETQVEDIRPLLATLNIDLDVTHEEKRLYEVDDPGLDWLTTFCREIDDSTFEEALSAFERRAGVGLEAFHEELETLGVADMSITERRVDRLAFYLQSYEVPVDRENEGVLLADAKSASFVGRDVVFFLGLDEQWTHGAPRRPWVETEAQYTRNIRAFQLLLQSGSEQYYLVQDATGGSPVTPCLYFEELLDTEYERFRDLPSTIHSGGKMETNEPTAFEHTSVGTTTDSIETVSQSSLSTYVNSPRDYYFSRIVDSPQKDYFLKGNLFHDFAEFYVNHPDFVDDDAVQEVVDLMLTEMRPLVRSVDEATRRTEYRIGLETIVSFLENRPPTDGAFLTPASGFGGNAIAAHFGKEVDSPVTERWFEDDGLGVKGKIDLVLKEDELLDFKSGSKKSDREVVKHSAMDEPTGEPNYQALLYLTYWRSQMPDEQLSFTFFHFLETVDDVIAGDASLQDTLTTVTYRPTTLASYVSTESFFEYLRAEGANDCQKILSKIDYETYAALFEAAALPETTDSDEIIESAFGEHMITQLKSVIGDYKYVTTGSKQVMREIARVNGRAFFKDDLDAFESFIDDRLEELNRRHGGEERFPIDGLGGEPNYRRVDNRDLLLEGDR